MEAMLSNLPLSQDSSFSSYAAGEFLSHGYTQNIITKQNLDDTLLAQFRCRDSTSGSFGSNRCAGCYRHTDPTHSDLHHEQHRTSSLDLDTSCGAAQSPPETLTRNRSRRIRNINRFKDQTLRQDGSTPCRD